jgi:hypothetical protein
MPGSVTSMFSEPGDFEAALREDGVLSTLVTGRGHFRARLTQITLHRLRLLAAEEHLPRIAFVAVPADAVLILLPIGNGASPIWGGIGMRAGYIITLGPDQRAHARTDGPCRWGTIRLPVRDLARYGRAERRRVRRSSIRRAVATSAGVAQRAAPTPSSRHPCCRN